MADDMREVILTQPAQITHSLAINTDVRVEGPCEAIVVAGMGGSGHPGDLLEALRLPKVPLVVHRDYDLPTLPFARPLVIVSSYSGNTEEALSAYEAARKEQLPLLVNTAGGTLEEWSRRDGVPLAKIDYPGMQPRHTLFASFTGMFMALKNSGLVDDVSRDLQRTAAVLADKIPGLEEPARALAQSLHGKTPVYTSSHTLSFAAKNFKIQTNENAKTPAFWNEFPELNHNEMVGFTNPQGAFHAVLLRDPHDHPRIQARMDVTKELYRQWGIEVTEFAVEGDSLLEKIFYAVCFGLWTTYHLALAYQTDPVPVTGVENFKQRLKEVAGNY